MLQVLLGSSAHGMAMYAAIGCLFTRPRWYCSGPGCESSPATRMIHAAANQSTKSPIAWSLTSSSYLRRPAAPCFLVCARVLVAHDATDRSNNRQRRPRPIAAPARGAVPRPAMYHGLTWNVRDM